MTTKELILKELMAAGSHTDSKGSENPVEPANSKENENNENNDGFISGQELAKRCELTRAAIWKAVNALRESGYNIEAFTNRGYRILLENIYNGDSITKNLYENSGAKVIFFENIDSTNNEAKRRLIDAPSKSLHKTAFVASTQTAGKGRLGRKFYSPGKTGVYISLVYSTGNITDPAFFTATAAVAVCRAMKKVFGIEGGIKWVNDIFVRGKKICGILTEGVSNFETGLIESAVIGIGINVEPNKEIPSEIKDIIGSILEKPCTDRERSRFVASVICELIYLLDNENNQRHLAMDEYRSRSILIGKKIQFSPVAGDEIHTFNATVKDISNNAELIVELENGETKYLSSGEITIHSKNLIL